MEPLATRSDLEKLSRRKWISRFETGYNRSCSTIAAPKTPKRSVVIADAMSLWRAAKEASDYSWRVWDENAQICQENVYRFKPDYLRLQPVIRRQSVGAIFTALSRKWREETGAESSLTKITANINYLRIIALGKPVVPLILMELRREPAPWFVALRAITGELNVGRRYSGNFQKIAEAWLIWGQQNGFI